jgi:hypothetical protein
MAPFLLQGAGAAIGGVQAGMSTASSMKGAGLKTNYWGFKRE